MKNTMYFKKTVTMLLMVAMIMALFVPFAFANDITRVDIQTMLQENEQKAVDNLLKAVQDEEALRCLGIWVTVRILGYDDGSGGVILNDCLVRLTDATGYTVLDALEKACGDRNISYTVTETPYGKYVSEIGGQVEAYFQPNENYYSGWSYRVWPIEYRPSQPQEDTMPWESADAYVLENGDKVTWYYTIPAQTWYTIMDNYGSINLIYRGGQTINVNVKGQKYEDIVNWNLLPFINLAGATVTLTRAGDGAELASAVSDSSGNAALQAPTVSRPTLGFISVKSKYFTAGNETGEIEHVASWKKPVIILR